MSSNSRYPAKPSTNAAGMEIIDSRKVRQLLMGDPKRREAILREEMTVASAAIVRIARAGANLTQAELANVLGVSQSRISQMERGIENDGKVLELVTLARVAQACGRELQLHLV